MDESALATKVACLVLFAVVTMCCGLLPLVLSKLTRSWAKKFEPGRVLLWVRSHSELIVSLVMCLGAGVLLATIFTHMIPEIREQFEAIEAAGALPKFGLPPGELFLCAGFFMVFFVEQMVHALLTRGHRRKRRRKVHRAAEAGVGAKNAEGDEADAEEGEAHPAGAHDHGLHLVATQHALRAYLTVVALSVHSVFEGFAVAFGVTPREVWVLFAAIMAHKVIVAFCIGEQLLATKRSACFIITNMAIFALATPLGVLLGIVVSQPDNPGSLLATGILQGLAAGTILYVIFFELLGPEQQKPGSGLLKFFVVLAGFVVMLVIHSSGGGHSHAHGGHSHGHGGHSHSPDLHSHTAGAHSHSHESHPHGHHDHDHGDGSDTHDDLMRRVDESLHSHDPDHAGHSHHTGHDDSGHDHRPNGHDHSSDSNHSNIHDHPGHSDHNDHFGHVHDHDSGHSDPGKHHNRSGHPDHHGDADHTAHHDHTGHSDHTDHSGRSDHADHSGHPHHADHPDHHDHTDHTGHSDHTDHPGHSDRNDHPGHSHHTDHPGHSDHTDHPGHSHHTDHSGHPDHSDHPGHSHHTDHPGHPDHTDHPGHSNQTDHSGHSDHTEHSKPHDHSGHRDLPGNTDDADQSHSDHSDHHDHTHDSHSTAASNHESDHLVAEQGQGTANATLVEYEVVQHDNISAIPDGTGVNIKTVPRELEGAREPSSHQLTRLEVGNPEEKLGDHGGPAPTPDQQNHSTGNGSQLEELHHHHDDGHDHRGRAAHDHHNPTGGDGNHAELDATQAERSQPDQRGGDALKDVNHDVVEPNDDLADANDKRIARGNYQRGLNVKDVESHTEGPTSEVHGNDTRQDTQIQDGA
ncbi:filaggrin-2-like [Pollicipes pollicipes]|uniref:filaggrin-2-like n=1 Tax=Pollicipes pollicipes TaxID=41117 RepID=UPI001884A48F|nr:filaggrin-2-like [Pollicipes pollicipes]